MKFFIACFLWCFGLALTHAAPSTKTAHHAKLDPLMVEQFWQTPLQDTNLGSLIKGRPALINFWATWCAPCVREMPLLDRVAQENPSLQVIGLALDTEKNIQMFTEKVQVSYPVFSVQWSLLPLMKKLGNPKGGLPFSLLVDENGQVKAFYVGELDDAQVSLFLQHLLPSQSSQ